MARLITIPFTFTGTKLSLNYATSAVGGLFVEIQTPDGKPIEGFSLEECQEMIGDQIDHIVSWKKGTDLSRWAGKLVRLRIVMKDADLYSLQFSSKE